MVQKNSQKNNRYTTKADAEKVKTALECCAMARHNPAFCEQCPYHDKNDKDSICVFQSAQDAVAVIELLELENAKLSEELYRKGLL